MHIKLILTQRLNLALEAQPCLYFACEVSVPIIVRVALVTVLAVAPPRASRPVAVQCAAGGEGLCPVGDAPHTGVNGNGNCRDICCLCDEGHKSGVHGVDNSLVGTDGTVRHQGWRHGDENLRRGVGVRPKGADYIDETQIVLRERAVGNGDIVQVSAAHPVVGASVRAVLCIYTPSGGGGWFIYLWGVQVRVSGVRLGVKTRQHERYSRTIGAKHLLVGGGRGLGGRRWGRGGE